MKLTFAVPVLAALLTNTGCTSLLSTHPFVTDEEAVTDSGLAGIWTNEDDSIIIRSKGKAYEITYLDGKDATRFTARLMKAGEAKLLDVSRDGDDPFVLNLHFIVRVWPEGGTLRWTIVDSEWLKEQVAQSLPTERADDRTMVTAPGPLVREMLMKVGADEKAYGKVEVWTKVQ